MERSGFRWPAWLGGSAAGTRQAAGASGGQHRGSRRLTWLGGAAVAVVALLSWDALAPFNREAWDQGRDIIDIVDNPRQDLYVEAMDRLPAGTPRTAVHDLLGAPDGGSSSGDRPADAYNVGTASYGIDPELLWIEYDLEGRTTRWWIERG